MRGILYYDTKYGTTERIARWLISEITYASIPMKNINDISNIDINCDFYILGCPIYIGKPRDEMCEFFMRNKDYLQNKVLFFFITSWAQSTKFHKECEKFIELTQHKLKPARAVLWASLPGKLVLSELTNRDRSTMLRLLGRIDKLSKEFQSENILFVDKTNEKESREFGKKINDWLRHSGNMF